ncbi:hypothetical protein B0J18DRAFT_482950 [Chaetomium sp. MPI-SDFR-AT-0129]|nr:hypothetical protein B0J18DRAFT_482950 [Chaetomium sp. MPI-SDFR-AT-0129]
MIDYILDPSGDVILTLEWYLEKDKSLPGSEKPTSPTHGPNDPRTDTPDRAKGKDRSENKNPEPQFTTFQLSSSHLILASPVFKAALTGGWEEGRMNNGKRHIRAEGFDLEAMKIVLDAVHCRNRQIPKTVTLEMLAKIATVVDYYAVHEAMGLFGPIWVEHLLKVENLPSTIIGCMNRQRREAFDTILHDLETYRSVLLDNKGCPNEVCSTLQLGTLTRTMYELKIIGSSSEECFHSFSLQEVEYKIQAISCPSWKSDSNRRHCCKTETNLNTLKEAIVACIRGKMKGLQLADFASPPSFA